MNTNYDKQMIKIGIITVSLACIANFVPALYLWFAEGVAFSIGDILKIWLIAFTTYGVSWIIQPISYFPSLGTTGSYVCWVAGSTADIRMPAATMARKSAGVEEGTPAGDVMSTVGVCCSVFVSVAIITIFTIIGASVINQLPPSITASFSYISAALFGAVFFDMASRNIQLGGSTIIACILLIMLIKAVGIPSGYSVLICVVAGILLARVLFVMGGKK